MNDTMISILRVLDRYTDVIGSREISRQLKAYGVDLTERTVRYHLRILDERGFTNVFGREGRKITAIGRDELSKSHVHGRVGFVINRIDALSYQTSFVPAKGCGSVILNISKVPEEKLSETIKIMRNFFPSPYVMSERLAMGRSGDVIGDYIIPEGKAAIGTVCSITINGIFLKAGIPVTSRFGGVLEIKAGVPTRFVSLISYEGSSIDPLEIFIRSRMTDVTGVLKSGNGRILASFREIPAICLEEARRLSRTLNSFKIGGILALGSPNRPLLEIPVGLEKVGMVVIGGLNPMAAVEEAGICTESKAMSTMIDYERLDRFSDAARRVL